MTGAQGEKGDQGTTGGRPAPMGRDGASRASTAPGRQVPRPPRTTRHWRFQGTRISSWPAGQLARSRVPTRAQGPTGRRRPRRRRRATRGLQGEKGTPGLQGDNRRRRAQGRQGAPVSGRQGAGPAASNGDDRADPRPRRRQRATAGLEGDTGAAGPAGCRRSGRSRRATAGIRATRRDRRRSSARSSTVAGTAPTGEQDDSPSTALDGNVRRQRGVLHPRHVTASYRSDASGNPLGTTLLDGRRRPRAIAGSGIAYVYCA